MEKIGKALAVLLFFFFILYGLNASDHLRLSDLATDKLLAKLLVIVIAGIVIWILHKNPSED